MTDLSTPAGSATLDPPAESASQGPARRRGPRLGSRRSLAPLGLLPFGLIYAAFFLLPTASILWLAIRSPAVAGKAAVPAQSGSLLGEQATKAQPAVPAQSAGFSWHYLDQAVHGTFLSGLENSLELSLITAVVSGITGLFLAWAVVNGRDSWFRRLVMSSSAVLANFGGLPLAFLFVCTLGSAGVLTKWLSDAGVSLSNDLHFSLYSLHGVELVYLYFLVPLMVLVVAPALERLRPQWGEAAESLGASRFQYWRYVAGPVLLPAVIGSVALLFCSAFSAYATAVALTNGTLAITPLQINQQLNGNVLTGPQTQHTAAALALVMVVVVIPLTVFYQLMERRTAKWLQS